MELEVWTFCVRCFQRDPSRPCQYCASRIPGDDNCVTAVLWSSSSKQPRVWVPVRPPPTTPQAQYMACPKGRQCEHKITCPKAHSSPPEAEIAYWNIEAPPTTRQRTLDAVVSVSPTQTTHLEQLLTRILNIDFKTPVGQRQLNKAFAQAIDTVPQLSPYLETLGWDPLKKHFQPPPWDSSNLIQLLLGITEGMSMGELRASVNALLRDEGPLEGKFVLARFYKKHKKPLSVRSRDKPGHEKLRDVLWDLSDEIVVSEDKKSFVIRLKSQSARMPKKPAKSPEWQFRTPPYINAKFTLCKNLPNCHYGNECNFAHNPLELTEWNVRARLRQIKSELHQQTARLQETDLHKQQPDILHRVAVSHPERKEWSIGGVAAVRVDGSHRKKISAACSGEQELIPNAVLGPAADGPAQAVEVSVVFDGKHPGKHEQWVIFQVKDFVTSYCFTIEVVDTNTADLKKKRLKDKTDAAIQFLSNRPKPLETKQFLASRSIGKAELHSSINEMPVLHWAVTFHCSVATIEALLDAGCDASALDSSGQTPLHIAAASHQVEVVKLLASRYPSLVSVKDSSGWTALQLAGANTSWPSVLELAKKGGDINAMDGDGTTLLHRASIAGDRGVVSFLLDLKADTQVKDSDDQVPYTKALRCNQEAIAQLLRSSSHSFQSAPQSMHAHQMASPHQFGGRFMHPHQGPMHPSHFAAAAAAHIQQQQQSQQQQQHTQQQQAQQPVLLSPHMHTHATPRITLQPGMKVPQWRFAPGGHMQHAAGQHVGMPPKSPAHMGQPAMVSMQHMGPQVSLASHMSMPRQPQQPQQQQQHHGGVPGSPGSHSIGSPHQGAHHPAASSGASTAAEQSTSAAGATRRRGSLNGSTLLFPAKRSPGSNAGSPRQAPSHSSPRAGPLPSRSFSESAHDYRPFSSDPQPYVPSSQHPSTSYSSWQSAYQPQVSVATSSAAPGSPEHRQHHPGVGTPMSPRSRLQTTGLGITASQVSEMSASPLARQQSAPSDMHAATTAASTGIGNTPNSTNSVTTTTASSSSATTSYAPTLSPLGKPQDLSPLLDNEPLSDAAIQHALGEFQDTLDSDFAPLPDEAAMRKAWDASTSSTDTELDALSGLASSLWSVDPLTATGSGGFGLGSSLAPTPPVLSSASSSLLSGGPLSQLFDAARAGAVDAFASLLSQVGKGPNVQQDGTRDGLLHVAIRFSNRGVCQHLLQDPSLEMSMINASGSTYLHEAATTGSTADLSSLITRCSNDVHVMWNLDGQAPIHTAISFGHTHFVKHYLSLAPHVVNVRAKDGKTPLLLAVDRLHADIVQALLAVPTCDPTAQTRTGDTALHIAVRQAAPKPLLQQLVQHMNGLLDTQNEAGDTPLHVAAAFDVPHAIDFLLQHGASSHVRNRAGQTPVAVSQQQQRHNHGIIYAQYTRRCSNCGMQDGTPGVTLRSCANCHTKLYCSKSCQEKDWYAKHSQECEMLRQRYEGQHGPA
ncbi:hypothetical protein PTSG_02998 [Salpingoeca rosetta]|uniref:Uncharacterized protein n=1 Tax=Salpingoeca rosetta (strain ATCC 50818 / BSB-021) TaxID=946362 RepID=F2U3Z1_SALR5|nr:uncharacterized protein PTSG_02998 [Salpingoeca rosetta]EGD82335.1 hypothetical protein PTSG_02998 [Salpingoeca rosetta]|eukprot:XP_004996518.1 hypothetical protein PTSG_02998 [Salpingoeca rosetta]